MHLDLDTKSLIIVLICLAPFLLFQGAWIFKDAKKRGVKFYWLWGFIGLLNIPESLILYLIVTRILFNKNKTKKN
ncbi:MAG: sigmaY antisigma factor component [Clostridiaceae bacterium]|nr:sigmaY antisigma factor component [Clostridiaceae bacterium]